MGIKNNWIYCIVIKGKIRYIGMTNDINKREAQHRLNLKKNKDNLLYKNIKHYNIDVELTLTPIKSFNNRSDAMRYEAYLILKDYFSDRHLWNKPPRVIKYF